MRDERLPSENQGPNEPPIPVPPVDESWSLMRSALDVRMPVTKTIYTRPPYLRPRFLGSLVLGAALTVIALKAVVHPAHRGSTTVLPRTTSAPAVSTAVTPAPSAATISSSSVTIPSSVAPISSPASSTPAPAGAARTSVTRAPAEPSVATRSATKTPPGRLTEMNSRRSHAHARQGRDFASVKPAAAPDKPDQDKSMRANPGASAAPRRPRYPVSRATLRSKPTFIRYALADSALRRRPTQPNHPAPQSPPARALSVGLTLADRFNLGGQQAAPYNIDGKQGAWTDYLPTAHLRAYSGINWDLQIDLGLFQPQHTRSQLIDSTGGDSSSISPFQGYRQYNVYVLKKLFYSDLTVTLHHRLFHDLWIGAGLDYGHLQGAVGDRQLLMDATNLSVRDTVLQTEVVSLKTNDTAYHRLSRSDWRVLFDLEYRLGRATIGLRYERALNSYLPVQADGSKGTQKNQSLSLRGSFELWRRR